MGFTIIIYYLEPISCPPTKTNKSNTSLAFSLFRIRIWNRSDATKETQNKWNLWRNELRYKKQSIESRVKMNRDTQEIRPSSKAWVTYMWHHISLEYAQITMNVLDDCFITQMDQTVFVSSLINDDKIL